MEKSSSRTKTKTTKKVAKKTTAAKKTISPKTKKVPSKKATVKKASSKEVPLIKAPTEKEFWTKDGQILSDLVALAESFSAMDDLLFKYHVNDGRNDFAEWVEHVLSDDICARSLRKANTPKKAHGVVVRRLRYYSN